MVGDSSVDTFSSVTNKSLCISCLSSISYSKSNSGSLILNGDTESISSNTSSISSGSPSV